MSFVDAVAQTDFANVSPKMRVAFGALDEFSPTITSVAHGHHVAGSAHYDHRAIDVGSFGSTPVGYNQQTWDAITAAIDSGQVEKIGTLKQLANNADLKAYAQAHGVDLFEDEGSGPHVHFQVSK